MSSCKRPSTTGSVTSTDSRMTAFRSISMGVSIVHPARVRALVRTALPAKISSMAAYGRGPSPASRRFHDKDDQDELSSVSGGMLGGSLPKTSLDARKDAFGVGAKTRVAKPA